MAADPVEEERHRAALDTAAFVDVVHSLLASCLERRNGHKKKIVRQGNYLSRIYKRNITNLYSPGMGAYWWPIPPIIGGPPGYS